MTTPIPRFKDLTPKIYSFGKFVLDLNAACLTSDGEEIKLRPKSFELLGYFVANSGRLLAKDELISAAWPDAFVGDDSLVQCVRDIRRALEDKNQQVLKTVPRRGYIFQAYVHSLREGATPQAATPQAATKHAVRPEMPSVSPAEMNPAAGFRRRWPMVVTGFAVLVVLAGSLAWLLKAKSEPQRMRAIPLTSYRGMERNPALSPDGNTVAFTWNGENENNFDIYLVPVGSSNPQRLTTDPAEDTSPEWSPDGRRIAFLRRLDGRRSQLILIPSTGGPEHVLAETGNRIVGGTADSSIRKDLAWTPDGQWIAVPHFNGDESPQGIYLVSVLDGSKRQLTQPGPGGRDGNPAFSPVEGTLAFIRVSGTGLIGGLYVQPLSKGFFPAGESKFVAAGATSSAWTSNGRLMYYGPEPKSAGFSDGSSLQLIDPSQSAPAQQMPVSDEVSEFSLGRHLVYTGGGGGSTDVWRAEVPPPNAPAAVPHLVIASTLPDSNPQFSPTGNEIVFKSKRSGTFELWVSRADGANPVQLTFLGGGVNFPNWSPDGQRILFHARLEGRQADLFSIPATGGQPKRLTWDSANNRLASYSRDGKWIYFESHRSGEEEIWKMPAEGGSATQLTFTSGKHLLSPVESPDQKYVFYAQGGSEVTIWKVPVEGGTPLQIEGVHATKDPAFAVTNDGIYYKSNSDLPPGQIIQFLEFATGKTRTVVKTEQEIGLGLSLSPDERYLIFAQRGAGRDLMLIKNFTVPR